LIITLTAIENWTEDGALSHNFNLINSWGKPGDIDVHYYPRVMSEQGRNYFVSYPPLSFIAFYGVVNIFNPSNLVVAFKLFGVLIHILSFWLVFYILKGKTSLWTANLLCGLFLFFPSSIVLSMMFYPEQLVILLMLVFIIIIESRHGVTKNCLLLIVSFLLVYCDWLGVLLIGSVVFFNIIISEIKEIKESTFLVLGGLIGGVFLLIQYSSISGFESLFNGMKLRYLERSGVFSETYSDRGVNLYSSNTIVYLYKHLLPTVSGVIFSLFLLDFKKVQILKSKWFWITIIPIVLHMILIFNSNILHFQNLAKLSIIFVLGITLWLTKKEIKPIIVCSVLALNISMSNYIVTNYFNNYSTSTSIYNKAEFINTYVKDENVCIILQEDFTEDLVLLSYLTKRNVICQKDVVSARKYFNSLGLNRKLTFLEWNNDRYQFVLE
jgi:hypothetical protein